ncbi:MAG: serine/threonine protein kinase [Gemmatimonadaceae bacterium]|nr:serine/threonine protein kinase [Gemmatimonadaceae bacterium]
MSLTKICPRCGDPYDDDVAFCAKDGTRLVRGGQTGDVIGTVVAERYRIVSRIGEGGMGQVYLAEHVRMKRKSAIKIMRPSLVGEVEALRRFTREAENASQLSHPNIAAIFDFGETPDGVVYLAMEYVDGESLADTLAREGLLHPDVAADILGQSADALQAAHDMNMLHRDIKPDNIMLGKRPDGTYMVKLVDFGIARTMDGNDERVTRTGFAVGTPQYMSPEQLAGESLDARSDQYALALVAFCALTGKLAFPAESSKESLIARLTSRPQSLQSAKEDVTWPESLQEIFDKALAPEPRDRFASVSEFAHALAGAISNMTPTQTAELYRRALDVRVANIAARTPHSDSGALAALSRTGGVDVTRTPTGGADMLTPPARPPMLPPSPRARWPFVIGGVMTLSVAATLWFTRGRESTAIDVTDSVSATALRAPDSTRGAAGDEPSRESASAASAAPTAGAATGTATAGMTAGTTGSRAGGTTGLTADSARKLATRDSLKREAARKAEKARADSVARVASVRAQFPEAAAQALLRRGVDTKARMAKSGDIRVVIMPTPVFIWRAEQARVWKDTHPAPGGGSYDLVDPIEQWSSWNRLVTTRRAVYVLEVGPEKALWPTFAPDRLSEIKKGDVSAVEMLRDGAPVVLEASSRITALANASAHVAAGKPVPNSIVATLSPTTFVPRDDGTLPTIELLVHDAAKGGAVTRVTLSESLVRRLYDDFAPWRDALARP